MFCHNNSAGIELLHTIDCLIADLEEDTARALKNIEKKMDLMRGGMTIRNWICDESR